MDKPLKMSICNRRLPEPGLVWRAGCLEASRAGGVPTTDKLIRPRSALTTSIYHSINSHKEQLSVIRGPTGILTVDLTRMNAYPVTSFAPPVNSLKSAYLGGQTYQLVNRALSDEQLENS